MQVSEQCAGVGRRGGVAAWWRRGVVFVLVAGLVGFVLVALPSGGAGAQSSAGEVRVVARELASGRVEFAVQQRHADDSWAGRLLPSRRFFPADAEVGRWLASSPLEVAASEVRVVARELASGRIEFAVQQRDADDSWGGRLLPSRRFFPADAEVGRWLASSPLQLTAPPPAPVVSQTLFGHLETDGPCAELPAHAPEGLCLVDAAPNTIRLFGCGTERRPESPDWHHHRDSGIHNSIRTRPLRLEVGTRIEVHNTCEIGGIETLGYVIGLPGVIERYPAWTDVVHGVIVCQILYGYDWTKGAATEPSTILGPRVKSYDATLHSDGRYGILGGIGMFVSKNCRLPDGG